MARDHVARGQHSVTPSATPTPISTTPLPATTIDAAISPSTTSADLNPSSRIYKTDKKESQLRQATPPRETPLRGLQPPLPAPPPAHLDHVVNSYNHQNHLGGMANLDAFTKLGHNPKDLVTLINRLEYKYSII